jgi:tetratricopeptide (TPR) repeat protein
MHMMAIIRGGKDRVSWNRKAIARADASKDPAAQAWLGSLYNNLGFAELELGRYEAALKTHRRAQAWYAERQDVRWERTSRWAVGKTLRLLDRCKEALPIQQELEAAWDAEGVPDGYVYEEIAECRLVLGEADVARGYFGKAYEVLSRDAWIVEHEPDRLERIQVLSRPPDAAAPRTPSSIGALGELAPSHHDDGSRSRSDEPTS